MLVKLDDLYSYKTRRKDQNNYFIPCVQTKQAQKSLIYSGTKIWNQIPKDIKELNLPKFKKELKRLYLLQ